MGLELTVNIAKARYDELIKTETRKNVLVELLARDEYISTSNIIRILGHSSLADSLDEKNEKVKKSMENIGNEIGRLSDAMSSICKNGKD